MIRFRSALALAATALLAFAGCDTNEGQDTFFLESEQPPEGFTTTDASGQVLDADPDDWRVAPAFRGSVEVVPASPNPVARDGLVTIVVQDTFGDILTGGVRVTGFTDASPSRFVELDRDAGNGPFYALSFRPTLLRTRGGDDARLFRVRVFTNDNRIISYGDLLVR